MELNNRIYDVKQPRCFRLLVNRNLNSKSSTLSAGRVYGSADRGGAAREVLTNAQRTKINREDDRQWYALPRLVHHSDSRFRGQVTQLYRNLIPDGAAVLDLCSSWTSHLPTEKRYTKVVGHGLNAEELAANTRLSQFFVRNLNQDPDGWALADAAFDAVLICCSVQYLQQPERVFAEIYRVLKPGGVCIVTFTNRLFYDKAIAAWRETSEYGRVQLVTSYFSAIVGFSEPQVYKKVGLPAAESAFESIVAAFKSLIGEGDPFYAVVSYKSLHGDGNM